MKAMMKALVVVMPVLSMARSQWAAVFIFRQKNSARQD